MRNISRLTEADLVLETPRLRLRPFALADEDLASELFTDPEVMKFLDGVIAPDKIPEETQNATRRGAGRRLGVWCVADKTSGEKLATAVLLPIPIDTTDVEWSLLREDSYPEREIEVGYILKPAVWGRGLATEICRALVRFAFEATDLPEIVAVTDPENWASQRVLTKCGLRHEGTRYAYAAEIPSFRMTRQDWNDIAPE
ncbi:MAG TPA: GNAT family N-acetyltransferase [Kiloniellaceae bacterium]|nr:GNAT family N-acetyltransferase [Kiloniellaceae bacterium]